MKNFCKLYISVNFFERDRYESRSYYCERILEEARKSALYHHANTVAISGEMFKTDIKHFTKILETEPSSNEPTEESHRYYVTFVITADKLLNEDSAESSNKDLTETSA